MKKSLICSILCLVLFFISSSCETVSVNTSIDETDSAISIEEYESVSDSEEPTVELIVDKQEYLFIMDGKQKPEKISATVKVDGKQIDSPNLSYEVKDTDICEINENTITPKSVGRTDVIISYGDLEQVVTVFVCEPTTKELVNSFDEKYVNLYGRTYISNNNLCLDHVATGIGVAFEGTELSVTFECAGTNYVCIFIDGAQGYLTRIKLEQGVSTHVVTKNLKAGFHTVRIVKSNEIDDGSIKVKEVFAEAFYTAPEKSSLYIEFIGDSITTGYGALGDQGMQRTVENSDGCSAFAYKTAALLGADYSIIAKQGICVKGKFIIRDTMSEIYNYVSTNTKEEYSFERKADIVVINLGTNDSNYIATSANLQAEFPNDYYEFLRLVREKNPDAHIICLYGLMNLDSKIIDGIASAAERMQDDKIYTECGTYIINTAGANGHPTKFAHTQWASILTKFIERNII